MKEFSITEFNNSCQEKATKFWSKIQVQTRLHRIHSTKLRIHFHSNTFIEIFYARQSQKYSFAIISEQKRVYGIDNSRGWPIHPPENPKKHKNIEEPDINTCFKMLDQAITKLNLE